MICLRTYIILCVCTEYNTHENVTDAHASKHDVNGLNKIEDKVHIIFQSGKCDHYYDNIIQDRKRTTLHFACIGISKCMVMKVKKN